MAYRQIPTLPPVIALNGTEEFEAVQAGLSSRVSISQVVAYVNSIPGALLTFSQPLQRIGNNVQLNTVPVSVGGTGTVNLPAFGLVYGNNVSPVGSVLPGITGQVLSGNTGGAPSWVNPSIFLTGYLPLTGGTLSGPGNLVVEGGLAGTTAYFAGNVDGIHTALQITNTSSGDFSTARFLLTLGNPGVYGIIELNNLGASPAVMSYFASALVPGGHAFNSSMDINGSGPTTKPTLTMRGTGQTNPNMTTATGLSGTLRIETDNVDPGTGGMVLFAMSGGSGYAAIKGQGVNGGGFTQGGLVFSTRRVQSDTSLTLAGQFDYLGNFVLNQTKFGIGVTPAFPIHVLSTAPSPDVQVMLEAPNIANGSSMHVRMGKSQAAVNENVNLIYTQQATNSTFQIGIFGDPPSRMFTYTRGASATIGGEFAAGGQPSGAVKISEGGAGNAGYIAFFRPDGVRTGYIGYSLSTSLDIQYTLDGAGSHNFTGGPINATAGVNVTGSVTTTNLYTNYLELLPQAQPHEGAQITWDSATGGTRNINNDMFDDLWRAFSVRKSDGNIVGLWEMDINGTLWTVHTPMTIPLATITGVVYGPLAAVGQVGFGADATNLGLRTYAGGGIYFQTSGGVTTYGYFNSTGFNLTLPLVGTSAWFNGSVTVDTPTAPPFVMGVASDLNTFNLLTFNGDMTINGALGVIAGGNAMYYLANATGSHVFRVAGIDKMILTPAGDMTLYGAAPPVFNAGVGRFYGNTDGLFLGLEVGNSNTGVNTTARMMLNLANIANVYGIVEVNHATHSMNYFAGSGLTSGHSMSGGRVSMEFGLTTFAGTVPAAGSTAQHMIKASNLANFGIYYGTGAPTFAANANSLYVRTDGSTTTTRLYVNTTGSTVWATITTSA